MHAQGNKICARMMVAIHNIDYYDFTATVAMICSYYMPIKFFS